jgi:hypothetical protein
MEGLSRSWIIGTSGFWDFKGIRRRRKEEESVKGEVYENVN